MRPSLLGLRATCRSALLLPSGTQAGSRQHPRRASYKIEERGKTVDKKHQEGVHLVLRRVRPGGLHNDSPSAASTRVEKARLRHERKTRLQQEETTKLQKGQNKALRNAISPVSTKSHSGSTDGIPQLAATAQDKTEVKVQRKEASLQEIPTSATKHSEDSSASDHNLELPPDTAHAYDGSREPLPKIRRTGSATPPSPRTVAAVDGREVDKWGRSIEIWYDLLLREARLKGKTGVEQVWTLIKEAEVNLPVKSKIADPFWALLLKNSELHEDVVAYAIRQRVRTGTSFSRLYSMLMRHYIQYHDTSEILRWHRRLVDGYCVGPQALNDTAISIATSTRDGGSLLFKRIYDDIHASCDPCYDRLIPALVNAGKIRQALFWHRVLLKHGDHPSPEMGISKSVQLLQKILRHVAEKKGPRMRRYRAAQITQITKQRTTQPQNQLPPQNKEDDTTKAPGVSSDLSVPFELVASDGGFLADPIETSQVSSSFPKPTKVRTDSLERTSQRGLISSLVAEMQNAGPNGFSDEFCARLYATRALTPSWVTSFIHAFSVKRIGPLSLRELALRAGSTEDLQYFLNDLRSKGVLIGASKFSLVIKRLAETGEAAMLQQMLESDQHPDTFGDDALQVKLLDKAVKDGDQASTQRILAVMSIFADEPREERSNLLLCSHIRNRNIQSMLKLVEEMQSQRIKITAPTVQWAARTLLRRRARSKRPDALVTDPEQMDLSIVTNIVLRAYDGGTEVPETIWGELFKRHGMRNLESVERFCHSTIASLQSSRFHGTSKKDTRARGVIPMTLPNTDIRSELAQKASLPVSSTANPLHYLFTAQRLQNIISWGFHEGLRRLITVKDRHNRLAEKRLIRRSDETGRYAGWPRDLVPPEPSQTFLCGIRVLENLRVKGIPLHPATIEEVLLQRLWTLYGPGRSARPRNIAATALNPYNILDVIRGADAMWTSKPLFRTIRFLLQPLPEEALRQSMLHERTHRQTKELGDSKELDKTSSDLQALTLRSGTNEMGVFLPFTGSEPTDKRDQTSRDKSYEIASSIAMSGKPAMAELASLDISGDSESTYGGPHDKVEELMAVNVKPTGFVPLSPPDNGTRKQPARNTTLIESTEALDELPNNALWSSDTAIKAEDYKDQEQREYSSVYYEDTDERRGGYHSTLCNADVHDGDIQKGREDTDQPSSLQKFDNQISHRRLSSDVLEANEITGQKESALLSKIEIFIAQNMEPPHDLDEVQTRRYIQALMFMFYNRETIGSGTWMEMRRNRKSLSDEQWMNLLYTWARQNVLRGTVHLIDWDVTFNVPV